VAEREIAIIEWREDGEVIDLVYSEGEPDRLVGTRAVVAELARSVGLVTVPAPSGTVRWARPPEPGDPSPS
jgi:hypothetical protein